jgi:long-chain acyl-CoA synthetase
MSENLAGRLIATVERYPDATALKLGDVTLTYAGLDDLTSRLATFLAERGIEPGDRVGIMLPNVPEFAVAYYAVLRAGAVVVPMNVLLKEREVAFYLSDPQAKLIFAWHQFEAEARKGAASVGTNCMVISPDGFGELLWGVTPRTEVVDRAGTDTAVILYTSGTTGKPKGAELTHANLDSNAQVSLELFLMTAGDIILGALPLFHAFGQTCTLNTAVASGATLVPVPRFDAEKVLAAIERRPGHSIRGRADHVRGALAPSGSRAVRHVVPAALHIRRCGDAGGDSAGLRGGNRVDYSRGLRPL